MQTDQEPSSKGMSWGLAIAGALVLGSMDSRPGAFLIGAVLGVLCAQVIHLRNWVRALHHRIEVERASSVQTPSTPDVTTAAASTTAQSTEAVRPTAPASTVQAAAPTPQVSRPIPPRPAAPVPPRPAIAEPSAASAPRPARVSQPAVKSPPSLIDGVADKAIAWLKGGNPLARAGIVILFFGAAFLAKYAAEHSLFPIELRFISIALGALALLVIGWRLREKRSVYAQLLQGGGIAGLYLTVFSAMKLYAMLPATLAFGLMVCIVLAAAVLAVAQNSLSLAFIGTAGGFLAPILVSTGSGNHIALFSYYALLNLGVFAIAWFRTWRVLNVLGFVFTFGITALWRVSSYETSDWISADAFLILFFLMYVTVSVLNCVRQPPNLKGYVSGSLVFGLPIVAFALHASLISHIEYGLAWSVLALGAFYLLLGWGLLRTGRESFRLLVESFAALGVIFASLTIPLAFDAQTTAAMWAVEGAGLTWLGLRQDRRLPRIFGALLQFGGAIALLSVIDRLQPERFLLNVAFVGTTMLSLSALASSYWLHRKRERLAPYESGSDQIYALWGVFAWLAGGLYQIVECLPEMTLGVALIHASLTTTALGWFAYKKQWQPVLRIVWFVPALSIALALAYLAEVSHPFAELGALGWAAILCVQYALLRAVDREGIQALGVPILHAIASWTVVLVLALELKWYAALNIGGVWSTLVWGLLPAAFMGWVSRRSPKPHWPITAHLETYRGLVTIPLAIFAALWLIGVNLTNEGDPVWLPYLPLLNPLDVGSGLVLACLALWWLSLGNEQRERIPDFSPLMQYGVFAGLTFIWLNAALVRALHYALNTPLHFDGIAHSTTVQAALSVFWGILGFAAMTLAARYKHRTVWMVGAVLMSVVVIKLFLIDLSNTGTVARIASFLSVGVLLLVTGYIAPLPPRKDEDLVDTTNRSDAPNEA